MRLLELNDQEVQGAYYDPAEDQINTRIPSDTRKPILTLKALNRLKRIRALRRMEALKREDTISMMYAPDAGGDGGAPGGGGLGF